MISLNDYGNSVNLIVSGAKLQVLALNCARSHVSVSSKIYKDLSSDIKYYQDIVSKYSPSCSSFDSSDIIRCLSCRYCLPPSERDNFHYCKLVK